MSTRIFVRAERAPGEKRVAATPDSVTKLMAVGLEVQVESGAGVGAGLDDSGYEAVGATIVAAGEPLHADVLCHVRPLTVSEAMELRPGMTTVGTVDPFAHLDVVAAIAARDIASFALDFLPRLSRAQSMDVLSSQSLIAGYKCALEAANAFGRMFPLTMTAAGTLAPARVLVLGAGVAGLQAIATAKRLGGIVKAYDVRSSSAEEVRSVGGTFVALDLEAADASGGYAKELGDDRARRQRELLTPYVAASDIVITTAAVPGRPAPQLITNEMMRGMKPGSVIVDLAAESGGNVEASEAGVRLQHPVDAGTVLVIGVKDIHSQLARDASALLGMNVANFLTAMAVEGEVVPDFADELVSGSCITWGGSVVHPRLSELLPERASR